MWGNIVFLMWCCHTLCSASIAGCSHFTGWVCLMEDSCTSSIPTVNGVIVDTCTVQTATVMEHNHYIHASIQSQTYNVVLVWMFVANSACLVWSDSLWFSSELWQCLCSMDQYVLSRWFEAKYYNVFPNSSTRSPLDIAKITIVLRMYTHVVVI